MAYEIIISDSIDIMTLPTLNVPLTEETLEGTTDVTTLDMNLFTDFFANKKLWSHTWAYMSESDFNDFRGFYDRQFTLYQYPEITISELGVTDQVVRMTLSPQQVIDNCGTVENVTVTFRQTVQMTDWSSS